MSRERHKPLSRLISFRISEADYKTLLESRQEMKAGSVSEAAREMVCAFLKTGGDIRKLGLEGSLRRIEGDMSDLRSELRRFQPE
jgi:IS1 family transposase